MRGNGASAEVVVGSLHWSCGMVVGGKLKLFGDLGLGEAERHICWSTELSIAVLQPG
jgi:hypothetical protein